MELTGVDIVIAIIVCISAMLGLVRGLVAELFSLVTWVAAVLGAIVFGPQVADMLIDYLGSATVRSIVGYAGIFVGVLMVGGIVRSLTRSLLSSAGLSGLDRLLGLVFGGLRGVLICIIALTMLRTFAADSEWWNNSTLIPELMQFEEEVRELGGYTSAVADEVSQRVLGKDVDEAAREAIEGTVRDSVDEAATKAVDEALQVTPDSRD